jgi:hypothetical protein
MNGQLYARMCEQMTELMNEPCQVDSLSPQHGMPSGCRWKGRPPDAGVAVSILSKLVRCSPSGAGE